MMIKLTIAASGEAQECAGVGMKQLVQGEATLSGACRSGWTLKWPLTRLARTAWR